MASPRGCLRGAWRAVTFLSRFVIAMCGGWVDLIVLALVVVVGRALGYSGETVACWVTVALVSWLYVRDKFDVRR